MYLTLTYIFYFSGHGDEVERRHARQCKHIPSIYLWSVSDMDTILQISADLASWYVVHLHSISPFWSYARYQESWNPHTFQADGLRVWSIVGKGAALGGMDTGGYVRWRMGSGKGAVGYGIRLSCSIGIGQNKWRASTASDATWRNPMEYMLYFARRNASDSDGILESIRRYPTKSDDFLAGGTPIGFTQLTSDSVDWFLIGVEEPNKIQTFVRNHQRRG